MLGINIGLSHLYSRLLKLFVEPAKLIEREQFWIDWLKPKYNLAPKAGSNLGVKYSDEAKTKMSAWQIGRKMSKEARVKIKIGLSNIGNKNNLGRIFSDEHKFNLSKARLGRKFSRKKETINYIMVNANA